MDESVKHRLYGLLDKSAALSLAKNAKVLYLAGCLDICSVLAPTRCTEIIQKMEAAQTRANLLNQTRAQLVALPTDATSEMDVARVDGDALGVDRAEVDVLEQAHQVGLGSLLKREDGGALEPIPSK
jgi:hypothetical protein